MELAKIRNLGDEELAHQEKTSAEQFFRLRFQVSMGQNDGVKKLRQLRKEIAQIKTVARERELGIHGEAKKRRRRSGCRSQGGEAKKPHRQLKKATKAQEGRARPPAAKTKTAKAKGARK